MTLRYLKVPPYLQFIIYSNTVNIPATVYNNQTTKYNSQSECDWYWYRNTDFTLVNSRKQHMIGKSDNASPQKRNSVPSLQKENRVLFKDVFTT